MDLVEIKKVSLTFFLIFLVKNLKNSLQEILKVEDCVPVDNTGCSNYSTEITDILYYM